MLMWVGSLVLNNVQLTIVIFLHYKPRLVVDEDALKWVSNEKKHIVIIKTAP